MTKNSNVLDAYIAFADALVVCGNERQAAMVAGIPPSQADSFVQEAYRIPEVLKILADDISSVPDFANKEEVRSHVLKTLWREARYRGAGANATARITAMKVLADIVGISNAKKVEITGKGGVMFVPTIDAALWEEQAEQMQKQLKETARES